MDDVYEIKWVGWDNSFKKGTQHDKVWGWLEMRDGRCFNFWGRRGKSLRFKIHSNRWDLEKLQDGKNRKGYDYIDPKDYDRLVKDFIDEIEFYCMTAILGDTVV